MTKILAISSGGGHWEQLMAMRGAFEGSDVTFVTTNPGLLEKYNIENGVVLPDCNRDSIGLVLKCMLNAFTLVLRLKPDVVISTGAAPGLLCLVAARVTGRKAIWIDSVANVEKLSMSGKFAGYIATLWLTQWEHLSTSKGPHYGGTIL